MYFPSRSHSSTSIQPAATFSTSGGESSRPRLVPLRLSFLSDCGVGIFNLLRDGILLQNCEILYPAIKMYNKIQFE